MMYLHHNSCHQMVVALVMVLARESAVVHTL
jgi:hypothetical protein